MDDKERIKKLENLLQRWLIFKDSLIKSGDGHGGYRYYGPVEETEKYFQRKIHEEDLI